MGDVDEHTLIANKMAADFLQRVNRLVRDGYYIWHPWYGDPLGEYKVEIVGTMVFVKDI